MSKTDTITRQLARKGKVDPSEGPNAAWQAIAEANRIFGPQGWMRETLEMRNAANRERDGMMTSAYVARIRVTVLGPDGSVVRESHGCGEGRGQTPFEAHDHGIKAAELDATLRALATFGKAFGLTAILDARNGTRPRADPGRTANRSGGGSQSGDPDEPDPEPTQLDHASASAQTGHGALLVPKMTRRRSPAHLAHVRSQPCLVCGRSPVDAHHLRFMQPRAMARKVSDEFAVPLCRRHHDLLHRDPDEAGWWASFGIDPLVTAMDLWEESQGKAGHELEDAAP